MRDYILRCAKGADGNEDMTLLGNYTDNYRVGKDVYTPWVMVDGRHEEGAESSLETYLCNGPLKGVPEC